MSRPKHATSNGAAPASTSTSSAGHEDMCPVCKSLRYLNKDLVFLINPECYHPICNNCVNRIYENGPNQCPYIGCHKTLRKKGYRLPYFGDLAVEREVDIRRRVSAVFNRTEDEFEDLPAYNDYLEMVETLTMDLVYGADAERNRATEKLVLWEAEHKADIERNRKAGERAKEASRRQLNAEAEAARLRRTENIKAEEEERKRAARQKEEDLDSLAKAPEGMANKIMLKKRGQHRREELAASEAAALRAAAAGGSLSIRGLKKKERTKTGGGLEDGPYDPYGGVDLVPTRYVLQDDYKNEWLDNAKTDPLHTVSGYTVQEYYARAMFEAFSGLGVFIEDEKETGQGTSAGSVATIGASMAASGPGKMELDDY